MNHHAWAIKSFYTLREMLQHFESHMYWVNIAKKIKQFICACYQ
jgi:hypothetical protein